MEVCFSQEEADIIAGKRARYSTEFAQRVGSPVTYTVTGCTQKKVHEIFNYTGKEYDDASAATKILILGEVPWNVALLDLQLFPVHANYDGDTNGKLDTPLTHNNIIYTPEGLLTTAEIVFNLFVVPNVNRLAINSADFLLKDTASFVHLMPKCMASDIEQLTSLGNFSGTNGLGEPIVDGSPSYYAHNLILQNLVTQHIPLNLHFNLQLNKLAFSNSILSTLYARLNDGTMTPIPSFYKNKELKKQILQNSGLLCFEIVPQKLLDCVLISNDREDNWVLGYRYRYTNLDINARIW